jgi:hypothetical protein
MGASLVNGGGTTFRGWRIGLLHGLRHRIAASRLKVAIAAVAQRDSLADAKSTSRKRDETALVAKERRPQ